MSAIQQICKYAYNDLSLTHNLPSVEGKGLQLYNCICNKTQLETSLQKNGAILKWGLGLFGTQGWMHFEKAYKMSSRTKSKPQ